MKVFVVGADMLIEKMFAENGHVVVPDVREAELVCFTGGADVHPKFYGDVQHPATRCYLDRDLREKNLLEDLPKDLPKVGICRGGQFLNVMSGGKMWQDCDMHAIRDTHALYYTESKYNFGYSMKANIAKATQVEVTSTHHQMMAPNLKEAELWGYAFRSSYRDRGNQRFEEADRKKCPDVEIVFYSDTKSLCFQPHPEYGVDSCKDLFFTCLSRAFA